MAKQQLDEAAVRGVVEQVLAQLSRSMGPANGPSVIVSPPPSPTMNTGDLGVHASVSDAVDAATRAFDEFSRVTIEHRRQAIDEIRRICVEQAEPLGKLELDETKIGRLDHKIEKLVTAGKRSPGVEFLKTDCFSGDNGVTLVEYAPFGVIGAVTPVTHSLPTLANNAISMLASGNTVVFNAHPSGATIAKMGVRKFNEAIRRAIGIDNLITIIDPPTIETAQGLFEHRDVRLLVVTGGPAVARAALASRKRAIVAGPGNPPVVVDETADIANAGASIVKGAAYDNNLLCIGEKEVFAVHSIFDGLLTSMERAGGFRLSDQLMRELEKAVFSPSPDNPTKIVVRKEFIGKDPSVLAKAIGLALPPGVQLLFGETGSESPFVDHEQMMPVVPVVRVRDVAEGIVLAKKYEHGFKHTAIMHSRNIQHLTLMARELDTTLFIKNAPCMAGLGLGGEGYISFSIATPTGEGVTNPLTFTRQRRNSIVGHLRII